MAFLPFARLRPFALACLACAWVMTGSATLGAAPVTARIEGGTADLRNNVSLYLSNLDTRELLQPRRFEARVVKATHKAMQALGYYDGSVIVSGIERGVTEITVTIEPGNPVKWRTPDIVITGEGQQDPALLQWLARKAPLKGNVLNHAVYDEFKKGLRRLSLQEGYFDAHFPRAELQIDRDKRRASMALTLDTGQRYHFGEIKVEGTRIRQKSLKPFITFKPGDPYQESKVTELYKALLDSGYFKDLSVKPEREKVSAHSVPVTISLTDETAHRFNVGAGYGTDNGVRTRFQWSKPVINEYGHSTGFNTQITERDKSAEFEYKVPDGHPAKDYYLGQASYIDEKIVDLRIKTTTFTLSHNHQFENFWVENLYTKLTQVNETKQSNGEEAAEEETSERFFVVPGVAYSQLELKGKPIVSEGHRYLVETEFSDPSIGSDTQFLKIHGFAKWLIPASQRQQLLFKLEAGSIHAQDFELVPITTRFFAGGDQSIRGYDYQTVSPVDSTGNPVGARYLTLATSEYLYQFADRWQWALFADRGRAFDNSEEPYRTGAGMGVRWLSPVGHVRFDIASRVGDENEGYELHIFMGPPL
jgi:translocation and assembly module TamA